MEPLTPITTLAEMWDLGYSLRRIPAGKNAADPRTQYFITTPNGREIGYGYTTSEVIRRVNDYRLTTPGAA